MRVYPFPDKQASREELKRDLLYRKIPPQDLAPMADRAWETGAEAARRALQEHPGMSIYALAQAQGLTVDHRAVDKVSGKVRYFSEYYAGRKTIFLYDESIGKWAGANGLSQGAAEELILAHEFFHHLECTCLGPTSRQYTVPQLELGPVRLGKSGIRALSEIGAHGFAYTWYQQRGKLPYGEKPEGAKLVNHAVNDTAFRGKNHAKKIMEDNPVMRALSGKGRR